MPRIVVVSNPRSRKNRRNPQLGAKLSALLGQNGAFFQPADMLELKSVVARIVDIHPEVLAISGGDGTAHMVLSALQQQWQGELPPLALLRGGTMNTVASGLGIKGSPEQLLSRLLKTEAPLKLAERTLLEVEVREGPGVSQGLQTGFLFGNGLVSNYLKAYYEGSEPSPAKAAWILLKGSISVATGGEFGRSLTREIEAEVEVEGRTFPMRSYLSIAAGTVDDIGLGFRPFYESISNPGKLHALLLGCSPWSFVKNLPRIWHAKPILAEGAISLVVPKLVLRAAEPIHFMVDGDFLPGGRELVVRAGKRVKIWQP